MQSSNESHEKETYGSKHGEDTCITCDGRIITVGHKNQVSSSCIMLTSLTPLPNGKCALIPYPSSRHQTILPSPTGPRSAWVSVSISYWGKQKNWLTGWNAGWPLTLSRYFDHDAGVRAAAGPSAVGPRRQRIWGCEGSPSGWEPYPTTVGGRAGGSQSSRGCWSRPDGGTLRPSPKMKKYHKD